MNLDLTDIDTIGSYIRAEQPNYKGPVFIDINGLEKMHMAFAEIVSHMAILNAKDNIDMLYGKRQKRGEC